MLDEKLPSSLSFDNTSDIEAKTLANANVDPTRVLRKLDWRLLPFVSMLYLLSFLDRSNIGNAKVAGLVTDIKLTGLQYNLCSAIFFIPYCFFEIPSNMAMKLMKPSRWIPIIMIAWGVVMLSMAFVKDFSGLLAARFFLGMTEAGLFPGVTYYLCLWYPRVAQAQRLSIFLSAATLSGAFGGLLAFAIEKMNGIGGLAGWAWIFLLEGLLTVIVAFVAYFFMYDYPETAGFLAPEERKWLVQTIRDDTAGLAKHWDWRFLFQALKDHKSYMLVGLYMAIVVPSYAFALFLPTIIVGFGFSSTHAQLLSIPPYVCGCFFTILAGFSSDRVRARGPFILGGSVIALVGYVILLTTTTPGAGYAGTLIAACGLFPAVACLLAWAGGNAGGDIKRGVVIAMVIGIGNLGGIVSSFIYRPQDSPRYRPGHSVAIGCLCVAILLSILGMLEFARLNRAKEAQCAREGITVERAAEFEDMGDDSPLYRYTI